MANPEINYNKINEFLSSFITHVPVVKEKECQPISIKYDFQTSSSSQYSRSKKSRLGIDRICNDPASLENTNSGKKKTLPTSEHDFKERLSTFEVGLWTSIDLSPSFCASYGWHLIGKDVLQCCTCKAVLCSSLPSPNQYEAYQKFLCVLKERLCTVHKEWCGWPSNPCPLEFLQPPISSTVHYLKKLKCDAVTLCNLNDRLPYVNRKKLFSILDLEENHVSVFYGNGQESNCVQLTAAILVLFGWVFDSSQKMKCNLCLRSVGLWAYMPLAREEEFLKLKENDKLRRERRKQKEIIRKEKERRRKVKEEKKLAVIERKRKAREAEEKAMEESKKVQEAMDKISRLEESGLFSDVEEARAAEEDLTEDEEKSLLEEEEKDESLSEEIACSDANEAMEETQHDLDSSKEINDQNDVVTEGSSTGIMDGSSVESFDSEKPVEEDYDAAVGTGGSSPLDNMSRSSQEEPEHDVETNSESEGDKNSGDEALSEGSNNDDELWLDAIGGFKGDANEAPSSADESEADSEKRDADRYSYASSSSFEGVETNKKRCRGPDDESDSEVDEASAKKVKLDIESPLDDDEVINSPDAKVTGDSGKVSAFGLENIRGNGLGYENIRGNGLGDENIRGNGRGDENIRGNGLGDDCMESINPSDLSAAHIENGCIATTPDENNSDEEVSESDEGQTSESEDEDPDDEEGRLSVLEKSLFDPVAEHRHWCGWVTKSLYHETGEKNTVFGYNVLPPQLREILPGLSSPNLASSQKYARNVEGLRAVRSILDSWAVYEEAEEDMEL